MPAPVEKIKQAILHEEMAVRDLAVRYFSESFSDDPQIMPLVIQAVEKYGWVRGVSPGRLDRPLVQTPQTVEWIVRQIQRGNTDVERDVHWGHWQEHLIRIGTDEVVDDGFDPESGRSSIPSRAWDGTIRARAAAGRSSRSAA